MLDNITLERDFKNDTTTACLTDAPEAASFPFLTGQEMLYLKNKLASENEGTIYKPPVFYFFCRFDGAGSSSNKSEAARKAGSRFFDLLSREKINTVQVTGHSDDKITMAFLEGLLLASYSFLKYKKKKNDFKIEALHLIDENIKSEDIEELKTLIQAVFNCRDLVNEPLSYLTAERFAKEAERLGNEAGFAVEIFGKEKIEALRMGGLLAVNKGSVDPPTFSILEWKPENSKNKKPIVLVGKGIVFDTGGLSLKPTSKSMDYMKCDMAGGAVVVSAIYAAAKNKLPVHLIGLIPATDNRPDGNAYVPGDIITMFDGTTVEVKNTDAEGRLVLADALSYAKRYNPSLVIDVATLTGSAELIAGSHAMAVMGNSPEALQSLKECGESTYERMIELPLWEEFSKPLESGIADINNLGVREAQTSIAGKFLEHFIDYPWLHLDIAGVAFLHEKDGYRPAGGTGFGVRLLYYFLKLFN